MNNIVLIGASLAKTEAAKGTTIEERMRLASKEMRNFWASTDEDVRFRAAVGGVLLVCNEEERARIEYEMRLLGGLSAASNGIPVDFSSLIDEEQKPIGLLGIWKESAVA